MRVELHSHTIFSDGELLPIELIRRAKVLGHEAIAITDHVSMSNVDKVVGKVRKDCELADEWGIKAIPGVEITHVPAAMIGKVARIARENGALWVVVHGETLVEPVEPGTNRAALMEPEVDMLAHPGILSLEEAQLAKDNDVVLEITSRRGHCLGNGNTARVGTEVGARMVVNTDTHAPSDLIDIEMATLIARASGLDEGAVRRAVDDEPRAIVRRLLA